MKYLRKDNLLYSITYLLWRGMPFLYGKIATMIYRRAIKHCGDGTTFAHNVYVGFPHRISIGERCHFASGVVLVAESSLGELTISDDVQISQDVVIDFTGRILIGQNVLISPGVRILSHDHGLNPHSVPTRHSLALENNVWIGALAIILPSTTNIGENAIVGAGAVVTKPVPANSIVAGNPARVIKMRDDV